MKSAPVFDPSSLLPNSKPRQTSICFIVRDLGHYHNARLEGVAQRGSLAVSVIEICNRSHFQAFNRARGNGTAYQRYTVFPERIFDDIPLARLRRSLASKLKLLSPQVIAIPGWSLPEALVSLGWAVSNSVPVVVMSESQRNDHARNPAAESVKRRLISLCSAVLVGGAPHVDYAADLGFERKRILTGYDVVDNEHFRTGAVQAREDAALRARLGLPLHFFLASCRFVPEKNLLRLLDAYGRYCASQPDPWSLVLLGDGPLRPDVEHNIRRLGLEKYAFAPGFMQYDALPAYYGLAGAFILPSVVEPWGLVINEAMAAGLPVLVSDRCGCASDLVVEGCNGLKFDPYNIERLANLMLRISSLPEVALAGMGRASQEIISRWTPELFGENLEKAVQAALSAPKPAASTLDRALLWILAHRR
jgi:glycosyltransferase involved in cell wall biosynthesis